MTGGLMSVTCPLDAQSKDICLKNGDTFLTCPLHRSSTMQSCSAGDHALRRGNSPLEPSKTAWRRRSSVNESTSPQSRSPAAADSN